MGRRGFSPEFNHEAVELATAQHRSLSASAAELGVAPRMHNMILTMERQGW